MGMINKKRIIELADFFYSSDNSEDVPLRLCCETGRYTGFNLDREEFISLFSTLAKSKDLKRDLEVFVEAKYAK
jgi:hypothetical protein